MNLEWAATTCCIQGVFVFREFYCNQEKLYKEQERNNKSNNLKYRKKLQRGITLKEKFAYFTEVKKKTIAQQLL